MRPLVVLLVLTFGTLVVAAPEARKGSLEELAREFWTWRAENQPVAGDDIPRIVRPKGWVPDWSGPTVAARGEEIRKYERRWRALDTAGWGIDRQVDYRLIGSAIARVKWELEVNPQWRRNPLFYIAQTEGSIFDLLLKPGPFDAERSAAIVRNLERIPQTLAEAKENLDQGISPFARLAIGQLQGVRPRLEEVARELAPQLTGPAKKEMAAATEKAIEALEGYLSWLEKQLPSMTEETAVGREAYLYFLRSVAVMPFTPEELVSMARQEWERSVVFETYENQRNHRLPKLPLFADEAAQIRQEARDEKAIRKFLEENGILTVPGWIRHYKNLPMPPYLAPLAYLGVTDDLTSEDRLDEDAVSYIWPPAPDLSYFYLSTAKDPRPLLVHEGIPGHYFQMVLSWANENPIRRFYYDSGANEGIGFYAEEMMLQAGLFDDRPRVREIIYSFMRLRALRVEVDVKLALGEFSIAEAGKYLEEAVPMDAATANQEAAFFAATPGQAISYQIGKLQIVSLLSEARRIQGEAFRLRDFHDFVWENGNVPIALQRWELLGLGDQVEGLGRP